MGKTTRRTSSGHSTPNLAGTPPSRPLYPTISHHSSSSSPYAESPLSARSSLLNVLTKPRHSLPAVSSLSATTISSYDSHNGPTTPEDEFSDQSTISSYASSIVSSREASVEELAKMYKNYLEKPFVTTKSLFKHSEFGHCTNPNWRWTSQVSLSV